MEVNIGDMKHISEDIEQDVCMPDWNSEQHTSSDAIYANLLYKHELRLKIFQLQKGCEDDAVSSVPIFCCGEPVKATITVLYRRLNGVKQKAKTRISSAL